MLIKNRVKLAKHFCDLGFKKGAEVGVLGGTYSIVLCETNPDLKLFSIDSWGIGEHRKEKYHMRKYEEAKERLAPYNTTLIRKLSLDAVKDFPDEFFDFVYIDANHKFDYVMRDIIEWTGKVRKGGIVAGHDYTDTALGVKTAIDAYVKAHSLLLNITSDYTDFIDKNAASWWFTKK